MTPQDLIAAFETVADAPDGVARLRELVLQLAVRGKLVPQDPEDEPASALLEIATTQKAALREQRRIRKQPEVPSESQGDFDIPSGWVWTCTAAVGVASPRYDLGDDQAAGFLPMAAIPTDFRGAPEPSERAWHEIRKGYTHIADGDVVIAKITPCFQNRKSCVVAGMPNKVGAGTTELHVISPIVNAVVPRYLLLFYRTPDFIAGGMAEFTGTAGQQRVPRDYFLFRPVPLPPLAEQHRIVARVDELMGLLDRLEAARNARDTTRTALRDAALSALRDAEDAESVQVAWTRVAEHMDDLFADPADVAPLRQAILQLAVRGRLVAQDSADEPARVLLERIAAEKARLVAAKEIRKSKALPPIEAEEVPFAVPEGWEWCHCQNLFLVVTDGDHQPPPRADEGVPFLVIGNVSSGTLDFSAPRFVPESYYRALDRIRRPAIGDVLYTVTGSFGITIPVVGETQFCVQRHIAILKRATDTSADYAALALRSPTALSYAVENATGTAQKTVSLSALRALPLPIPPLAEQHRIVARVDALMALCDDLETRLAAAKDAREQFAAAAVHHLDA